MIFEKIFNAALALLCVGKNRLASRDSTSAKSEAKDVPRTQLTIYMNAFDVPKKLHFLAKNMALHGRQAHELIIVSIVVATNRSYVFSKIRMVEGSIKLTFDEAEILVAVVFQGIVGSVCPSEFSEKWEHPVEDPVSFYWHLPMMSVPVVEEGRPSFYVNCLELYDVKDLVPFLPTQVPVSMTQLEAASGSIS